MKKVSLILFALFFAAQGFSQKTFKIGVFDVKKIDFSYGYETDMVNNLDYSYFVNQMPLSQQGLFKSTDFNPSSLYGGVCENPSINIGLTLIHPRFQNIEWRNALAFKNNRVDAVSYYNANDDFRDYVTFNSMHNEYTLESALIYKLPVMRGFNLYGGVGTNLGLTPKNQTCVSADVTFNVDDLNFQNTQEINDQIMNGEMSGYHACYDTGAQLNQRVFLQGGFGIKLFNKLEFGMDLKYGYGYRADFQNTPIATNIIASNLNVRYILSDRED